MIVYRSANLYSAVETRQPCARHDRVVGMVLGRRPNCMPRYARRTLTLIQLSHTILRIYSHA